MARIRNISPLGDLYVPSLNVTVPSGAVLVLDDDQQDVADNLLAQTSAWAEVGARTTTTDTTAEPVAEEPVSPDNPDSGVTDPTPVDATEPATNLDGPAPADADA